jgi:hypothetical protein
MVPRLAILAACLILPACHRVTEDSLDGIKVDSAQTAVALNAVNHFRDTFNARGCQSIYDEATQYFRAQEWKEWDNQCRQLEDRLGEWRSSQFLYAERCGSPNLVVCVVVRAEFEKKSTDVSLMFVLGRDRARLDMIQLREDGEKWQNYPPPSRSRQRFSDPPAAKSLNGAAAS